MRFQYYLLSGGALGLLAALAAMPAAPAGASQKVSFPCSPSDPNYPNCDPNPVHVSASGYPIPIDHFPPDAMELSPKGNISAAFFGNSLLAPHEGFLTGLNVVSKNLPGPRPAALPTLAQVTFRFSYTGAFDFDSNIDGYDVTTQDLGSIRLVTLTAQPGALELGQELPAGAPLVESWNLTIPQTSADLSAFFASTVTGQGFGAAQTPEPGAFALLGGLLLVSGAALRNRRRRL